MLVLKKKDENNKCQGVMCRKQNPVLLVGISNGTSTMENGVAAPQNTEIYNCFITQQFYFWEQSPKN